MKPSTLLLLLLCSTTLCSGSERGYLLNTLSQKSELNWKTYSKGDGWVEETVPSKVDGTNERVYSTCDCDLNNSDDWLLLPRLELQQAARLQVEIGYTNVRCENDVDSRNMAERKLQLYAVALSKEDVLYENWHNETEWTLVDAQFSGTDGQHKQEQIGWYDANSPDVYLAFRSIGACASILYVKVRTVEPKSASPSWWHFFIPSSRHGWWWLFIGLISATIVFCLFLVVVCSTRARNRKNGGQLLAAYSQGNPSYAPIYGRCNETPHLLNATKQYVDPAVYDDPNQALVEFTREIRPENLQVTRVIGAGEFGQVCVGRLTTKDDFGQIQQHVVAVKTLCAGSSVKAKKDFLTEAMIMGQFDDENVIHLLGVATKSDPVMIITEFMLNGSLDQFLRTSDSKSFSTLQLLRMLHGIASGMKYLTCKGYVHRDLAARNVLVDDMLTCKISDFGLSRWLSQTPGEQAYTTQNGGKIPIRWTAPEAFKYHKYTELSDVWSFGIVMWEVFSFGAQPYWDWPNEKVVSEIENGYRLPTPNDATPKLYSVMLACWKDERQKRPNFADLVEEFDNRIKEMNCM